MKGLFALAVAATLTAGCYDSRWGEAKRVQQHNAAHATPSALQASTSDPSSDAPPGAAKLAPVARTFRVRVYATPAYEAQTLDWRRRVTELLDDADRILAPAAGVRLDVESFREWDAGEQDLEAAVTALKARDDGHDVDWVMGFVGGLSRTTRSFHELGMADVPGKHLVVRASRDLDEQAAIDRGLDELKEEDRAKLVRTRMRHRATGVLLHEVGHNLGAIHARDERDLMHPQYDTHMESYGTASLALIQTTLRYRDDAGSKDAAQALLTVLAEAPGEPWVPAEREAYESRLHHVKEAAAPSATPADDASPVVAASVGDKPLPADVAALPADVQTRFADASRALDAGDAEGALAKARPLFTSQPNVYAVQDLRCKIALARNVDWATSRTECDRLMKLSTGKTK